MYGKRRSSHSLVSPFQATIGGVVCFNGKAFGLSTAHGFLENMDLAAPDDDSDFEFQFDDWKGNVELDRVATPVPSLGKSSL